MWSVKAGADQSQQWCHGKMGVVWVCEMGLVWWRRHGVGSSNKLSHRVLAASLTAWVAAESLSVSRLSLSLSCLLARRFSFLFSFCFFRLETTVFGVGFTFLNLPSFSAFFTCGLAGWVNANGLQIWRGPREEPKSFFFFFFFEN